MKICVYGLWHLGCVTAACLSSGGHQVTGLDSDESIVEKLTQGITPIFEPGLDDLFKKGFATVSLKFSATSSEALDGAELVWVTYDTPVDEEDQADVKFVFDKVEQIFPHLEEGTLVLISSQLPVGSTRQLMKSYARMYPERNVHFAYSPENLRLGKAIEVFTKPDRVVVGCETDMTRKLIEKVFAPFSPRFEWMTIESAEMTKHALNAFLATSVTFINEIAALCEQVGGDAKQVERGLKSDARIGEKAYLGPGSAFSGGTLARDVQFLQDLGLSRKVETPLISGVSRSNHLHKRWAFQRLNQILGSLNGKKIAVWGLAYKAGTDTLRRSGALENALDMAGKGAQIFAFDPLIKSLSEDVRGRLILGSSLAETLQDAHALVVFNSWPEIRELDADFFISKMKNPLVLDANRYLSFKLESVEKLQYIAVGKGF